LDAKNALWANTAGSAMDAYTATCAIDAGNATLLDSQGAAYYLAWDNITGIPVDIADGDDVGGDGDITDVYSWSGLAGGEPNCCNVPGDTNNEGNVNILDITYLTAYLYQSGPPPCMYKGDASGNCAINILDITYLIAYLYKSGPAPICASGCPGW